MFTLAATMDPTVQGILYLIAVVLFVIAAVAARLTIPMALVAAGLAFTVFVWMWNAFALS